MTLRLDLSGGVAFLLERRAGCVVTMYGERSVAGTREETEENVQEARDQGYVGEGACLRSLAEHELMHTLATRALWGRESHVLRTLAGLERASYAVRMHEEALVLSLQGWLCTGTTDRVLDHVPAAVMQSALDARSMLRSALS